MLYPFLTLSLLCSIIYCKEVISMKYVKNSNLPLIIGAIVILAIGLVIGLNINKKEVYTRIDMVASTGSNNSNNEIEVIGEEINIKEEQVISDNSSSENNSINIISNDDSTSSKNTQSNNSTTNNTNTSETITYSSNDEVVINSLENSLTKINNGDGSDSSFADSAKGVFVSIVDFLFYNGEINGVTFDELSLIHISEPTRH